jgi:GntR family transcriptional regulator, rspAB operon transcriptional repressor
MAASARVRGYRGKNLQTLCAEIYETLKADIVTCRIPPGAVLYERELAERFQTSKAPVREALKRLAEGRLIESRPSVGHFVSPVTLKDVRELFQMRQIIECGILAEVTRVATDDQLANLELLVGESFALDGEASRLRWHEQNVAFHAGIAALLRNERLVATMQTVLEGMYRLEYVNLSFRAETDGMVRDHRGIVEALRLRDGDLAVARSRAATDGSLRLIQASLAGGEPAS